MSKKCDIYHICLALAECEPETKFEVIPSPDENYVSLSVGVFIKNIESEAGQQVPIFEHIRSIDLFNFMPQSLKSLVADLPDDRFEILRSKFESYSNRVLQLLCQKGFYCYSYITSEHVFGKKSCRHHRNGRIHCMAVKSLLAKPTQSCSNSVFKICLSKHRQLPRTLSNL